MFKVFIRKCFVELDRFSGVMKVLALTLVLVVVSLFYLQRVLALEDAIKSSIDEVIRSVYSNKTLYLITDEADETLQLMNEILKSARDVSVQIESFNNIRTLAERRRNVMIFTATLKSFIKLAEVINGNRFDIGGFYFIVSLEMKSSDVNAMFKILWKKFIVNVDVLSVAKSSINVQTFVPFSVGKCFDTKAQIINSFDNKTLKWKFTNFFPKKLRKLHNCPIKITTFEYEPAVIVRKSGNGSISLVGNDIELMKGLSNILSFKIELNFMPNYGDWGFLHKNGTATGAQKLLLDGRTDVVIGWLYMAYLKSLFFSQGEAYFMVPLVVVVPPGSSFTPLEKLLIPFEVNVWASLLAVLIVAFIVIVIVDFQANRSVRNLIIGVEIKSPLMELLVALCGSSSHKLPRQHFARFLLALFLLFCLVMRTLYQSGLFHFMQSDKKVREVETVDELISKGFTVYTYPNAMHYLSEMKIADM